MKDCLLICDKNCATYKEVFPLFKQGIVSFGSPVKEYDGTDRKFGNHSWITTFPVPNKKKLVLTATYDPALYPKYDNYDAIEVSRVKNIPYNYVGVMGCPITILDYDLDNVEIEGLSASAGYNPDIVGIPLTKPGDARCLIDGKNKYARILIKKKIVIMGLYCDSRADGYGLIKGTPVPDKNGVPRFGFFCKGKQVYTRILIRRKQL